MVIGAVYPNINRTFSLKYMFLKAFSAGHIHSFGIFQKGNQIRGEAVRMCTGIDEPNNESGRSFHFKGKIEKM